MEENKELLELLQKMEKNSRQQVKWTRLMCVFTLAAAIFCGCAFVFVYNLLPQINTVISQTQIVLSNLEKATAQLSVVDFSGMVADVDALVSTAQDSLNQTMNTLDTINFAALNQAIEDLSKVVEPMSKLMNVFK